MTRKHGGARSGAGRPAYKTQQEATVNRSISLPRWMDDLLVKEGHKMASKTIFKALLAYYANKKEVKKWIKKNE